MKIVDRNISKNRKNTGKDYINNFRNKLIPKRVTARHVRENVLFKITDQNKVSILEMFHVSPEKFLKWSYLVIAPTFSCCCPTVKILNSEKILYIQFYFIQF